MRASSVSASTFVATSRSAVTRFVASAACTLALSENNREKRPLKCVFAVDTADERDPAWPSISDALARHAADSAFASPAL